VPIEDFPDLLRRAKAGDESAFADLFRSTQPLVLRYLASLAHHSMVEDIAGEVWVSVVRSLDTFVDDDPGGFQAWVLTMARRRWIDEVRRRTRRPESLGASDSMVDWPATTDVESEVDQRLGEGAALRLLKQLPPDQAEVVMLRAVAGLDVEHVARIVGKTAGSVRVLSHRGLRRLAALLEPGVTNRLPSSIEDAR
jgi:RNA polymerase sigma-70 factor (ECF subfamily)